MRINMNTGANLINIGYINKSSGQKSQTDKNEKQEKSYSVSISPLGKRNNLINGLMKQRQVIVENKNELINTALKNGDGMDSIKTQLENYDKLLDDIDKQLIQISTESAEQKTKKTEAANNQDTQTDEETQTESIESIIGLSSDLSQMRTVSSVKTRIDDEIGSLKTEIKLDESRGGASGLKKERLSDLEKKSSGIAAKLNENLADINEDLRSRRDTHTVRRNQSESDEKPDGYDLNDNGSKDKTII
jgi:archaellum component FlaC